MVWRGVWHGVVLVRNGQQLYHTATGVVFVLVGLAALWGGLKLLLPLTGDATVYVSVDRAPTQDHRGTVNLLD